MAKIAIVTDSTAYLPDDYIEKNRITVVPLSVNFGTETRREGIDIKTREFYDMLPRLKELPTTSQPAVGEFVQAFESLVKTYDTVIGMFLSSGLSGTYNAAKTAAEMVGGDITVIDSKITSYPLARMVMEAVDMRDAGKSKEEIVSRVQQIVDNVKGYFVVDSLEHLHKGGRISGVSALVGSLLQIKPVLYVTEEGKLDLLDKVRTKRKALDRLVSLLREDKQAQPDLPIRLAVVYTQDEQAAREFQDRIRQEFPDVEPDLSELGPVIGTHVGPGMLAICYYLG
ncbi:DegV family protein [Effusibacillus pohliae]|uniref:DegV family protein n=1 Tax=Effusibacillus pohliae TaxID=232270 RepID=UPI0003799FD3|nr:DegV family protein [Effusibacillus pohliae]